MPWPAIDAINYSMASIDNVGKSRGRPALGATPITVRIHPDLLSAIDAFIAERSEYGENLTRPEAVRRLTAEALQKMGLMKAG